MSSSAVTQPSTIPSEIVSDVVEQKNESLRWFNQNYYGEFSEIYKNLHCRTQPLINELTKQEIKNRTNISLPDHFVMVRRGTARLTVNPPNLRVRGGSDQAQRDKVAALNYFQWDRSQEQRVLRQMVHQCKAIGWSVEKTYWDKVAAVRQLWRYTAKLSRTDLMKKEGAPQDRIDTAVGQLGEQLDEGTISAAIAKYGDRVQLDVPTTKYEGPVGARIFIGDIFVEPGFRSIHQSNYVVEYSERDVRWLKYWSNMKTTNPYTGQEQPVMVPQQVQDLIDRGGRSLTYQRDMDLRRQLRLAINQSDPRTNFDPRLRGPRYSILERHTHDDSGYVVVDFIGDEAVHLGRMWYPWKTYGKYLYSELVLIPDLLGGIGSSTPRVSRFLMQLRNTRANQTTDYINNVLRPTATILDTNDTPEEQFVRTSWGNLIRVQSHEDIKWRTDMPQLPPSAFQDQAQLIREMQQVAPETTDFSPGTDQTPQSGKFATTAVLQKQSTDTIMGDELAQLNLLMVDVLELRMYMNQQAMQEAQQIPQGVDQRIDAISARLQTDQGGDVATITVDPMDIQEDFEIFPEVGSTLSADDEYKRSAIERGFMMAASNPDVFNKRAFAEKLASTIPGMNVQEAILPPAPPPPPEVKINVSVAVKWSELQPDVQTAILGAAGLPTQDTQKQGALDAVQALSDAADAASNLQQPDHDLPAPPAPTNPGTNGNQSKVAP